MLQVVRVSVFLCVSVCVGVSVQGLRVDGASGAGNARAGRAGVRRVPVPVPVPVGVGVGVIVPLVCVRV